MRIPINQSGFHGMSFQGFVAVAQLGSIICWHFLLVVAVTRGHGSALSYADPMLRADKASETESPF